MNLIIILLLVIILTFIALLFYIFYKLIKIMSHMTDLIKSDNIQEVYSEVNSNISESQIEGSRYSDVYSMSEDDIKQIKNFNVN